MRKIPLPGRLLLAVLLPQLVAGCANLGPGALQNQRLGYNLAVQRTNDEQLLLNLVRLRYRDTPHFLEVSSVSTQFTYQARGGLGLAIRPNSDPVDLDGDISYTERPTISYAPLQGEQFIQRVLSPASAEKIQLLYRSGWAIDRVLRLCVQRLNGVSNAASASGPTPTQAPDYQEFLDGVRALRRMQLQDHLELSYEQRNGAPQLMLRLAPESEGSPEITALRQAFHLPPGRLEFRLIAGGHPVGGEYITVETRSLLGSLFYLSVGVEIPGADVAAGLVTRTAARENFDWHAVVGDLFRVHSSAQRPARAAVTVRYRGHWFYVADDDLESKSTFALLTQLFSLQAGGSKNVAPVLTLPIGG